MGNACKLLFLFCVPCLVYGQSPIDKAHQNIDTTGQKDIIDIGRALLKSKKPRNDSIDVKKKIYFSFLPVSTSVPGGGTALVTSTTAGVYMGDRSTTYISSVSFTPYFNLKGRFGLPIRSNVWLNNNSWVIQGDTRFLVYPQYTWGLGGNQPESDRLLLSYNYIRFYQAVLKRITSYFYAGIGYNLDYYIDIENNDNSHPFPGVYANFVYRYYAEALGSVESWQSVYADFRKYVSLTNNGPKNLLAFWAYYWTVLNTPAPYLDLPAIGMDPYNRSGRGIEQNRYRGKRLIYFESEYRLDITRNGLLGFVVFANINSAGQPITNDFAYWNPAAGAGLRIKFNKKSDTNICIDYGVSKNYSTLILGLGEAF